MFTVTPATAAINPVSDAGGDLAAQQRGQRPYQVTGLDNDTQYTIALFSGENVTVDENDVVTFADEETDAQGVVVGDGAADGLGQSGALITNAQGATTGDDDGVITVTPVGGTINFTVNAYRFGRGRPSDGPPNHLRRHRRDAGVEP